MGTHTSNKCYRSYDDFLYLTKVIGLIGVSLQKTTHSSDVLIRTDVLVEILLKDKNLGNMLVKRQNTTMNYC